MRTTFLRPVLLTASIVASVGIVSVGLALRPAFAVGGAATVGAFTIVHCSSALPCQSYNNGGKGAGLQGFNTNTSVLGAGLIGTATKNGTGVAGNASTGAGVSGTSASGPGVQGNSAFVGVEGLSSSSSGVVGVTSSNGASAAGVQGDNNASSIAIRANGFGGPLFVGNNSAGANVFDVDDAGNTAIGGGETVTGISGKGALAAGTIASYLGVSGSGYEGVVGFGYGTNPYGVVAANNATSGGQALTVQDLSGTGALITGFNSSSSLKFLVQDDGTVYAHAFNATLDTHAGPKVTTYANQLSTPKIEDFGEAKLTAGQSYVKLEPTFAATIDSRFAYMVFITPDGDTRGLYVAQRTPTGFLVRENQGGRSTSAFSYRIVAKPYGSVEARLAFVPVVRSGIAPPHFLLNQPIVPKLHYVPKSRI